MRLFHVTFGLMILAASLISYTMTLAFPPGTSVDPGPAYFPRMVLSGTILLTLIYMVQTLKSKNRESIFTVLEKSNLRTLLLVVFVTIVFVLLFGKVPFMILAPLVFLALCKILRLSWMSAVLTALILSSAVYLIFTKGFRVLL